MNALIDPKQGTDARFVKISMMIADADISVRKQMFAKLADAYGRLHESDYDNRAMHLSTMAATGLADALNIYSQVIFAPLPKREATDYGVGSYENEVVVRLTALEGVSTLAIKESVAAEKMLIEIAGSSSERAIQAQAVQGYLNAPFLGGKPDSYAAYRESRIFRQREALLQRYLPEDRRYLITSRILTPFDMSIKVEVTGHGK